LLERSRVSVSSGFALKRRLTLEKSVLGLITGP
jgi:hypothetical protein